MTARKTLEIDKILDYANGFLSARGGSKESRYGVICMIENILFRAERYRGFVYLSENEVAKDDLPGIRWKDTVPSNQFDNTDVTRRRYA